MCDKTVIITIEDSEEEETDPLRLSPLPPDIDPVADCKPSILLTTPNSMGKMIRPVQILAEKFPLSPLKNCVGSTKQVKRRLPAGQLITVKPKETVMLPEPVIFINKDDQTPGSSKEFTIPELFHKFTLICLEKDESQDMEKVIIKLKRIYEQAIPDYVKSREFKELVEQKISQIQSDPDPEEVYVHLKPVYDELRLRKLRLSGSQTTSGKTKKGGKSEAGLGADAGAERDKGEEEEEEDTVEMGPESKKLQGKIKKLEHALKICDRRIKKLEMTEVDFEDDEDSTYIQLQRYKDRFQKLYKLLSSYTGERDYMNRARVVCSTPFPDVNRCIEAFVDKTGNFPDFRDISSIIERTVEREHLDLTPTQIHTLAMQEFESVGNQLQKFRQTSDWNNLSVFLENEVDPADEDATLLAKLATNRETAVMKLNEVIGTYAKKQEEKKLEAEEVTEEQANRSAGEEEEGDEDDDVHGGEEDEDMWESKTKDFDYFGDTEKMPSSTASCEGDDLLTTLKLKRKTSEPELFLDVVTGLFIEAGNKSDTANSRATSDIVGVDSLDSINLPLTNKDHIAGIPVAAKESVKVTSQAPTTDTKNKVNSLLSLGCKIPSPVKERDTKCATGFEPVVRSVVNDTECAKEMNAVGVDNKPELLDECEPQRVVAEVTLVSSDSEESKVPEIVQKVPPPETAAIPKAVGLKPMLMSNSTKFGLLRNNPSILVIRQPSSSNALAAGSKRVIQVTKQESTCVRSEKVEKDGLKVVETKYKTVRVRSFANNTFAKNPAKKAKISMDDDDEVIIID